MSFGPPLIESPPEWQTYLDLTYDIKPYLQIPLSDTSRDTDLQLVTDAACWWAQDYLSQPIAPTTFFRRFNGYSGFGGSTIDLPYAPVLDVPTVIEYWGASGSRTDQNCAVTQGSATVTDGACLSTDVGSFVSGQGLPNGCVILSVDPGVSFVLSLPATASVNPASLVVSAGHVLALQTPQQQGGSDMFTLDAPRGIIIRSYLGLLQRPTFPGLKNIEVTWTAGRSPIPRHWLLATKELVKWWWVNTQQASRSFKPAGEYDESAGHYGLWPGVPDRISMMFSTALHVGLA